MAVLLTDTFESYAARGISDAALGSWDCYQIGLEAGTGHGGSKAAVSYQGALSQAGVNSPPETRWGNTVVWAYRFSVAELAARGRDALFYRGINIQPAKTGSSQSHAGFGVLNDALGTQFGAGHPNDMALFVNWRAIDGSFGRYRTWSSPVVVDSLWQHYDFRWKLSTVGTSGLYLNPDGCVQLYVDGLLVIDASGLLLTLWNNTGPTVANIWDGCYYGVCGLIDDLALSNDDLGLCAGVPPPAFEGEPRVDNSVPCCGASGGTGSGPGAESHAAAAAVARVVCGRRRRPGRHRRDAQ